MSKQIEIVLEFCNDAVKEKSEFTRNGFSEWQKETFPVTHNITSNFDPISNKQENN